MGLPGISETALIPLAGRARARAWHSSFQDPWAARWAAELGADIAGGIPLRREDAIAVARASSIDRLCADAIEANPRTRVIQLGAGFCSRFHRLGGSAEWIDLDRPEIISRRRELLPRDVSGRHQLVAADVRDDGWFEDHVRAAPPGRPILVIAEGLLHYLDPVDVEALFSRLWDLDRPVRMIFDFYPRWLARQARAEVSGGPVRLRWGVRSLQELQLLSGAQVTRVESLLDGEEAARIPWLRRLRVVPGFTNLYRVAELRFGTGAHA